jgi:hypothetical protein
LQLNPLNLLHNLLHYLAFASAHLYFYGLKVTEDYWHSLNPGDMVKNKDGHWQMRDNAASYAAGLGGSTATHS